MRYEIPADVMEEAKAKTEQVIWDKMTQLRIQARNTRLADQLRQLSHEMTVIAIGDPVNQSIDVIDMSRAIPQGEVVACSSSYHQNIGTLDKSPILFVDGASGTHQYCPRCLTNDHPDLMTLAYMGKIIRYQSEVMLPIRNLLCNTERILMATVWTKMQENQAIPPASQGAKNFVLLTKAMLIRGVEPAESELEKFDNVVTGRRHTIV
jgi:hypothetical protein